MFCLLLFGASVLVIVVVVVVVFVLVVAVDRFVFRQYVPRGAMLPLRVE